MTTPEPLLLENVPDIHDVRIMLVLLESLGLTVERFDGTQATHRVHLNPVSEVPVDLAGNCAALPLRDCSPRRGRSLPGGDRIDADA